MAEFGGRLPESQAWGVAHSWDFQQHAANVPLPSPPPPPHKQSIYSFHSPAANLTPII